MSEDRWERLEALLDEALDLDEASLAGWLAQLSAEDRPTLERLLRAQRAADGFFETPAPQAAAHLVEEGPALAGTQLGPYKIVREIGRGGMGAVYLAHREDLDLNVAIKRLPSALASPLALRAFLAERRTLAQLEHPYIARLLDAGIDAESQPYFVMEWVDGVSLTRYCDESGLDVAERVALFRQVCDAVEYAHHRLVVHRDLKPSNVFVARDGTPKLLDFGIAKALHDSVGSSATRTVGHLMTPRYASPEQIRGEEIGTTSDIYSLGVMLYELLCGRPPYDVESGTPFEQGRVILDTTPPPLADAIPSDRAGEVASTRRTSPRRLRQQLEGDLSTIVAQAMHQDRDRRYSSAAGFAEDLGRHLAGHAVRARGDSVRYRTGRFVGRHRWAAAFASLALLALAGFGVYHTQRIAAERDAAQLQAATARSVSDFLIGVFQEADPDYFGGEEPTATDLLRRGAEQIHEQVDGDPAVRARLLEVLGEVHRKLGRYAEAEPLLEESLDLRRQNLDRDDPELIQSLTHLASLRMDQRDMERAVELHREAYSLSVRIYGEDHPEAVFRLHNLGTSLRSIERFEEAEDCLRRSLAGRTKILGEEHGAVANAWSALANAVRDQGRKEEAADLYREALTRARAAYGDDHVRVSGVLHHLGRLQLQIDQDAEAKESLVEALVIRRRVYGEDSVRLAPTLMTLAAAYERLGDLAAAEDAHGEVLALVEAAHGREGKSWEDASSSFGKFLRRIGRGADADVWEAIASSP